MIKGELANGFKFAIEDYVLDDMELIELINEADEDGSKVPALLNKLLGKKQKKAMYDSLRTEHGNVPLEATRDALVSIFEQCDELKNSQPSPE